jgi:nucleoside-diphosphate-sugar epimerase
MLVAARDARVKRFVFAGSSSTYGDQRTAEGRGLHVNAASAIRRHQGGGLELYARLPVKHMGW